MKKFFLAVAVLAVLVYLAGGDDEAAPAPATSTTSAPAAPSKPATQRPNVEFSYGFKFVKLRVYSCAPCSESQANSAANLLAESGKVTAHAFFPVGTDFAALESKIASAGSFVNAEQILKAAEPKEFRRVMANGAMLDY